MSEGDRKTTAAASIGRAIGGRRTYSGTMKWWRAHNHKDLEWRVQLKTDDGHLSLMVKPAEAGLSGDKIEFDASDSFPTFKSEAGDIEYENAEQFVGAVADLAKEQELREIVRREISSLLL